MDYDSVNESKVLDLIEKLGNKSVMIPESVAKHYLNLAGLNIVDTRMIRFISLAAEKFISDVSAEAQQQCQKRCRNVIIPTYRLDDIAEAASNACTSDDADSELESDEWETVSTFSNGPGINAAMETDAATTNLIATMLGKGDCDVSEKPQTAVIRDNTEDRSNYKLKMEDLLPALEKFKNHNWFK